MQDDTCKRHQVTLGMTIHSDQCLREIVLLDLGGLGLLLTFPNGPIRCGVSAKIKITDVR